MPDAVTPEPERAAADAVRRRIVAACRRSGRDPASVTLVAATKTVEPERIRAAGVLDAGENRVQDLLAKQEFLKQEPIRWHFIGRLQRNKVRKIAGRIVLVHGVDSIETGQALGGAAHAMGVVQDVLVEVNTSGENSKGGVEPAQAGEFVASLRRAEGLAVKGLMTIPAPGDPEQSRPGFRLLATLARELGLEHLSMGMTGDFEIAVEEGATLVRVGSAIFGHRPG